MIKLWGTAVENLENIKHRAPVLNLTWALELRPEPYKPVFYYISEVTRSASPPWQPGLQKYSVTHCDIHLEKSPCGNLHQLLQKGFRNLLSFKRNWFHFSNFNFSVFFFHLLYTSFKGFKLSWSQSEGWRRELSIIIGEREVTVVSPEFLFLKVKWILKCLLHPKIIKMSFLLWTPIALSSIASLESILLLV